MIFKLIIFILVSIFIYWVYKNYFKKIKDNIDDKNVKKYTSNIAKFVCNNTKDDNYFHTAAKFLNENLSSNLICDNKNMILEKRKIEKLKIENHKTMKDSFIKAKTTEVLKKINNNTIFGEEENGVLFLLEDEYIYSDYLCEKDDIKIALIFRPYEKIFYPNCYHSTLEEFMKSKNSDMRKKEKLLEYGIYQIEVPEKIENIQYDNVLKNWVYTDIPNKDPIENIIKDFLTTNLLTKEFKSYSNKKVNKKIMYY